MEIELNEIEARILGCLIEKELTTPEYYPLTLNSLRTACNQKSNREPVMNLDDDEVIMSLDSLKRYRLVLERHETGARVQKYEHNLPAKWSFSPEEVAIICVLLLRGPQTVGEMRQRSSRMYNFKDLEHVEDTLQLLLHRDDGPFVVQLPRQPGRKEMRYMHLFCGEITVDALQAEHAPEQTPFTAAAPQSAPSVQTPAPGTDSEKRLAQLEEDVIILKNEFDILKNQFAEFKKQFE